ncbi:TM1266 family iron-only hydrogenase system putative regulator [Oceanidesulfovibrio marinus]|uniref:CopG family transcriptional regulator n=1 Tax=Oceanidesulfovibrio marinus TaxID=370038 RepID=A0A6P1ZCB7_9BACT|nr:TM1266 family iron-only hydrogenase system putative regulator [Oceanidesulfovibrio marinus]QJT10858.1 CopG family transcriptional regulator [Oceanidesulfovibrio marinus]TVM31837.1 CopG family transcriptional regulator [Oceanidesulfovibrio marinus]
MEKRIGIIGIIIKERQKTAHRVNELLSEHGDLIVGRMGLPFRDKGINVINLIIEASTDEVGALTGKLGMLEGVRVKSFVV